MLGGFPFREVATISQPVGGRRRPAGVGLLIGGVLLTVGCASPSVPLTGPAFLSVTDERRTSAESVAAPARARQTTWMNAGDGMQALVEEGERWWTRSPDPENLVACATCHHDPTATRGWAASFPKVKPMPPPHARVMTLLQANAEAAARHYRLADALPAATALTTYLTWHGAGVPISPGVSPGQPAFPERMRALAASVARGDRLYASRCARCHDAGEIAEAAGSFPRVESGRVVTLEGFLEGHPSTSQGLPWDSPAMADLIAYLMSRISGQPVGMGMDGGAAVSR